MKPCPRALLERDYTRKNELLHEQVRKEVANQNYDEFTILMELGNPSVPAVNAEGGR